MNETAMNAALDAYMALRGPEQLNGAVEAFLPFSAIIARKFSGRGVEDDDLKQVAAMALCDALERFDEQKGAAFQTFATHTIAGKLRNYIRDKSASMRVPRSAWEQMPAFRDALDALENELMRSPTAQELAARMNLPLDRILMLLAARAGARTVSLEAEDEEGRTLADILAGDGEDDYEGVENRDAIAWAMRQLTEKERRLFELRFVHQMSQREAAHDMEISQMQVSRMERRALDRLHALSQDAR